MKNSLASQNKIAGVAVIQVIDTLISKKMITTCNLSGNSNCVIHSLTLPFVKPKEVGPYYCALDIALLSSAREEIKKMDRDMLMLRGEIGARSLAYSVVVKSIQNILHL